MWEAEIVYEVLDGGPCESLLLSVAHRHGEVVDCRHGGSVFMRRVLVVVCFVIVNLLLLLLLLFEVLEARFTDVGASESKLFNLTNLIKQVKEEEYIKLVYVCCCMSSMCVIERVVVLICSWSCTKRVATTRMGA